MFSMMEGTLFGNHFERGRRTNIDLTFEVKQQGPWTVLEVAGEIDLHSAPQVRNNINTRLEEGQTQIAMDLAGVEFIDSSGLAALISGQKKAAEASGSLVLVSPTEPVKRALSVTGLDKIFKVYGSLDEAAPVSGN